MAVPTTTVYKIPSGASLHAGRFGSATVTPVGPSAALALSLNTTVVAGDAAFGVVANTGGIAATWSLSSTPGAAISPSSGTLQPGSSVSFSVTPPSSGTYSVALSSSGGTVSGSPRTLVATAPVVSPPPQSGAYRSTRNYLFQPVLTGQYASTLGGNAYGADIWGPTATYIDFQGGWAWNTAGGDVLTTPLTTVALNAAAGSTTAYTYSMDVTALVQAAQTGDRWLALRMNPSGGARSLAGLHTAGVGAPSIAVLYSTGGSATLACRCVATAGGSTNSLPNTTLTRYPLPAFLEFDRPTAPVVSATMTFTITEHWSGNCTATLQLLNPPTNTAPDTATGAGLAASGGVLDASLAGVSGVIGVHRYVDGSTLSDFVTAPGLNFGSESNYSPEFWPDRSLPADTGKWPYLGAGKWVVQVGTPSPALVASSYTGEGFSPLAPGLGALKLTMPDENPATGDEVGRNGTLASNLKLFMPPAHFGKLGRIFVRYYVRLGTPYAPKREDRVEVLQAGVRVWTVMSGKWGINAAHETSDGGVSGDSGGGYGWQMRGSWADCEADMAGPSEGGIVVGHHLFDFQAYNPVGHRYGVEQPMQFERWGQKGGLGGYLYAGRWYLIEQELWLNSINIPAGTYGADGELRTWMDGRLAFERTGMVFRTAPLTDTRGMVYTPSKLRPALELGVKELWLNWFHGGQNVSTYPRTMFVTGLAYGTARIGAMKLQSTPPPSWAPPPLTAVSIGYATNSHPTPGKLATLWDARPSNQPWFYQDGTPSTNGDGGIWAKATRGYPWVWNAFTAYNGTVWCGKQRKRAWIGAGHQCPNVGMPLFFDYATLSYEWAGVPLPTDGLSIIGGHQAATAALVAAAYPPEQFDVTWGDWQGSFAGWPAGRAQPGKIAAATAHTYTFPAWIPGEAHGNTNGIILYPMSAQEQSTGSNIRGDHYWDLDYSGGDIGGWHRTATRRISTTETVAGGGHYHYGVNRFFMSAATASTTTAIMDVYEPSTQTWSVSTATNAIHVGSDWSGYNEYTSPEAPHGLLLAMHGETPSGVPTYAGNRMKIWACSAQQAVAGGHTWTALNVTATSWPLRALDDTVATNKWRWVGYRKGTYWGRYYAIDGRNGSTTLWELTPPSTVGAANEAAAIALLLAGTWAVTTRTLATPIVSMAQSTPSAWFMYDKLAYDDLADCLLYHDDHVDSREQAIGLPPL